MRLGISLQLQLYFFSVSKGGEQYSWCASSQEGLRHSLAGRTSWFVLGQRPLE